MAQEHERLVDWYLFGLGLALGLGVISLWMPWLYSGAKNRHAFELLDVAEELDLGPSLLRSVWKWLLPFVPLLGAAGFLAAVTNWSKISVGAALGVVGILGGGVLVSLLEDLDRGYGTLVAATSCCAVLCLVSARALFGRN